MRAAVVLLASACVFTVPGVAFRANDGASAFERSVSAVTTYCGGTRFVNPDAQIVTSHWRAFSTAQGQYLARCQVAVVKAADELGAEVRVATAFKLCTDAGVGEPDALADSNDCPLVFELPKEVAEPAEDAVRKVEYEVRR